MKVSRKSHKRKLKSGRIVIVRDHMMNIKNKPVSKKTGITFFERKLNEIEDKKLGNWLEAYKEFINNMTDNIINGRTTIREEINGFADDFPIEDKQGLIDDVEEDLEFIDINDKRNKYDIKLSLESNIRGHLEDNVDELIESKEESLHHELKQHQENLSRLGKHMRGEI